MGMHIKLSRRSSAVRARGIALGIVACALWASCKGEQEEAPAAEPAPAAASAAADNAAAPAPEAAQVAAEEAQQATGDTGSGAPEAAAAPGRTLDKPLLWEARRGEAVSHLLGTVHVEYRMNELPAAVLDRLDAASTLVVETDATAISIPAMMQRAMLPPDQSLRAMLGDERWGRLVSELGSMLPPPALERMQPWIVGALLAIGEQGMKTDPSQVMDMEILLRGRSQSKRAVFLEEPDEQIALLARSVDLDSLKEMLDDMDRVHRMMAEQLAAYGRGDFEALSKVILDPEEMRKRPEFYETLIFGRNRAWMGTLKELLAEGDVFVAVGAGHFPGEQGLLALLREAGYEVRRVEP